MILIGTNLSPFTRRIAVAMHLLGIRYERRLLSTQKDAAELRKFNPIGRAPTLVLDDGTSLCDSGVILHYLLGQYAAERLLPPSGAARVRALTICGIAVSTMEKATALFVEARLRNAGTRRPAEEVRLANQVRVGLELLDARVRDCEPAALATIDAVCAFDFLRALPAQVWSGDERKCGALAALSDSCNRQGALRDFPI